MSAQPSSQPVEQVSVQWFLSAGRWCKHLIHIFKWLNKILISEIPVGAMEATNSLVFGVAEEELFNKCLFKQISLTDLKNELNNRQLDCFQADSYHILTSKLKLHILEQCQAMPLVREDIKNEIAAFYSTGPGRQKKVYQCCLIGCKFQAKQHKNYIRHLQFHGTITQKLVCQLRGCTRELSNLVMLKNHIKTSHRLPRSSLLSVKQNQMIQELVQLRCLETSCQHQTVLNVKDLKTHLMKIHTEKREMVSCPFAECNFETNVSGTFKSHFNRKHPLQQVENLKEAVVNDKFRDDFNIDIDVIDVEMTTNEASGDEYDANDDVQSENGSFTEETFEDEEIFLKSLAILFNNWMNVAGIPYTTVNMIVSEVFRSYHMGVDITKQQIEKNLSQEGVENIKIKDILEKVGKDDPFLKAQEHLEKENKRLKFIQEAFENTPPMTIRLNPQYEPKAETYQYVSLISSLKQLIEDETFILQKNSNPYFAEDGVVKDVRDGKNFRENSFFQENPDAVPILLFQDELEITNPLGAGKSKHKFNATYYTVLDVQSALRSKVKSIQLVSLVPSKLWKKHGNEKCNAELIKDLHELESRGVEVNVPEHKVVKAALCYIVGDNLGLHQLAELSASFSSGYICRVCQIEYKDACQNHRIYSNCEEGFQPDSFTKENYDTFANLAEENGEASAETRGIKGKCIFNSLKSYHCVDGMPPCLGHDFFEGRD